MTGTLGRAAALAYGVLAYAVFAATALYAIGFLANAVVPTTVDGGVTAAPTTTGVIVAVAIDLLLLGLFALQHTVMARAGFKRWWTRYVPVPIERSTYVLAAGLALLLLFILWQPLPTTVWDVGPAAGRIALWVLYGLGWLLVLTSTFQIDHADLVGLRQTYLHARQRPYRPPAFQTPLLHRVVRHPMMTGFLIVFWATPTMTVGHVLFTAVLTGFILIGVRLEERDLRAAAPEYARYAAVTPRFLPLPRRRLHRRDRDARRPPRASAARP